MSWPREVVADVLPEGLSLPDGAGTGGRHPILLCFGRQRQTALLYGGLATPVGTDYAEFGILIPLVHAGESPWFWSYVPCMYAEYFAATWIGEHFYGLGKRPARTRVADSQWILSDEHDRLLFHAVVKRGSSAEGASPGRQMIETMGRLPVLGRRSDGRWIRCYFGWDFGSARVADMTASFSIDRPLWGGIRPRVDPGLPGATFWIQSLVWKLSWPETFEIDHVR